MSLTIETREVGEIAIVTLTGPFIAGAGTAASECTKSLIAAGRTKILLNLEDVTEFDDVGVGWLCAVLTSVYRSGGKIKVLRPSLAVRIGFLKAHLVGRPPIEQMFSVYRSEPDALAAFELE